MKLLTLIALVGCVAATQAYKEVCYDGLGCFSDAPPFTAPGRKVKLPNSPEKVNTKFYLFTKKNLDSPQMIKFEDDYALENSNFDGAKPTKFIVHGWIDGYGIGPWMQDVAKAFLTQDDYNVFVVDWHGGSRNMYAQSVADCRVAGAVIEQLVTWLHQKTGLAYSNVHLLGHSLGAQVCGYAGERRPEIGRITGFDPANPYFQNQSREVRLDETDAQFVDVIHTDASGILNIVNIFNGQNGMGVWEPSGHVDVYPNGGKKQPGCKETGPIKWILTEGIVDGMRFIVACAHMRSYEFFLDSIGSQCPWKAYQCPGGYEEFQTGRCLRCPSDGDKTIGCNRLGYNSVKPSDGSVNNMYYLNTGSKSSFCRYHYHIQLKMKSKNNKDQQGLVWVKLADDRQSTDFIQLGTDNFKMKPGRVYDFLIISDQEFKEVKSLEVKWKHDAKFYEMGQWQIGTPKIYIESISAFSGEHQSEINFCDTQGELKSKKSRWLSSC